MLLSIPVEDLFTSELDIKLGDTNSRLSCKLKPNVHRAGSAPEEWGGITINIESVQGENGCSLTIYASSDDTARPSTSATKSPSNPPHSAGLLPHYDAATYGHGHGPRGHILPLGRHIPFSGLLFPHSPGSWIMAPPSCHSGESDCVELQSPSPACDRHNASPSASDSSSASSPSSPHTTFIACATPPPSETDTHPENTAPNRVGRRGQYPCLHPSCSRVLTSPYTRQVHMGTHAPKPRKAFLCTMGCGEVFTRQHDRHRHEVALHGKKCTHVCARCKRFFSTAKMLDRHVCRGHRQGAIQWPLGDDEVADVRSAPAA
ncbi:hypothetical protein B0H14DRAFT_3728308 [Mycena olivaceomarginata]|nr:hypothetical protein B0H14DRAFT_3728308 [Mycena olivaceomarginata]